MRPVLDGFASLLAAVATFVISFLPCWFAYLALDAGIAPSWSWAVIALLCLVGLILTLAFLRKAVLGIAPSREGRRK